MVANRSSGTLSVPTLVVSGPAPGTSGAVHLRDENSGALDPSPGTTCVGAHGLTLRSGTIALAFFTATSIGVCEEQGGSLPLGWLTMGFPSSGRIGGRHWSTLFSGQLPSNEDTSTRTRCRGEPFTRATRLKEPSCSAVTWRLTPDTPGAVDSPLSALGTGPHSRTEGTSVVGRTDHCRAHGPTAGSATSEDTSSRVHGHSRLYILCITAGVVRR
ncbi:hypothetical protein FKM82_027349 [Ascaphus truei]